MVYPHLLSISFFQCTNQGSCLENLSPLPELFLGGTHQHVNVVHEVQGQESELHDKISVIHIGSLSFPSPFMVEVPEVNYISAI